MTTTRDRGREARAASSGPRWDERSAFGTGGWAWWAAVVLALGLSIVGAVIDEKVNADIATIFRTAFVIGCVGAVAMVRRRNLFGPMVQPPLILIVVVPLVAAAMDNAGGSKVILVGQKLIANFPVMAITTGVTVVLGVARYLVQRRPVDDDPDRDRPRRPESRDRDRDRVPSGRDRDIDDRPSSGSRGSRPPAGRGGQDRVPPRERGRVDPGRSRGGSDRDRGADRGGDRGADRSRSSRDQRDRGRDPRDRDPRDRDPRGGQPRARAPRDRDPRREPRRRDDDY
ncbi:MAG TPA: DUF6542 domain-containing protein [Pseudonocardiaceae bacterium]|nr:DUF6542 domain-containing protein [Pseudonocardiaceae bacterium]